LKQLCQGVGIVRVRQLFEVDFTSLDSPGQCHERASLLPAEAERPIRCQRQSRKVAGSRKWIVFVLACSRSAHIARGCEAVEELEADVERQLLAGDRVDESLQQCWKSWRFEAAEPPCEESQVRISPSHSIPLGEIEAKPEKTLNRAPDTLYLGLRPDRRRRGDDHSWRRR
jgi:hypothetical protein